MKRVLSIGMMVLVILVGCIAGAAATPRSGMAGDVDGLFAQAMAEHAFPGACIVVGDRRHILYKKCYGYHTYRKEVRTQVGDEFDIASMTKVVATTAAIMKLYDEHKISLDDPVVKYLPNFKGPNRQQTRLKKVISIRDLLTHVSGLPPDNFVNEIKGVSNKQRWRMLLRTPLDNTPRLRMKYSDIGFLLLGKVVEKVSGQSLNRYVRKNIFQPLKMQHTQFKPPKTLRDKIVPTLSDLPPGKVHDPVARVLGGVAGHAGVFASIGDLQHFAQMMLRGGEYNGKQIFKKDTVRLFTAMDGRVPGSSRALGWDTVYAVANKDWIPAFAGMTGSRAGATESWEPVCVKKERRPVYPKSRNLGMFLNKLVYSTARNKNRKPRCMPPKQYSSGKYIEPRAFGHTGFTGTSMWVSPKQGVYMILLSNRVYPGVQMRGKRTDKYWRQRIASTVWRDLGFKRRNALYAEKRRGWLYVHAKKVRDFWHEKVAGRRQSNLDSGSRKLVRNDGDKIQSRKKKKDWIPAFAGMTGRQAGMTKNATKVRLGDDVLFTKNYHGLIKDKRVALIANSASVNSQQQNVFDLLRRDKTCKLTALFTPEHGFSLRHDDKV